MSIYKDLRSLCYEHQPRRHEALDVPSESILSCSDILLPELSFQLIENTSEIEITPEQLDNLSSFSKTFESRFPAPSNLLKLKTFSHDMTFGIWLARTDCKISQFYPKVSPDIGSLTPDYILATDDRVFVVEFTTCNSENVGTVKRSFMDKIAKYQDALLACTSTDKKKRPISFFVVAVGNSVVVTNLGLNDVTARELVCRFRLTIVIRNSLDIFRAADPYMASDISPQELQLEDFLTKCCALPSLEEEFSPQNVDKLLQPPDSREIRSMHVHCLSEAMTEVRKLSKLAPSELTEVSQRVTTEWSAYLKTCESKAPNGFANHQKSVVNIPFSIPTIDYTATMDPLPLLASMPFIDDGHNATLTAWLHTASNYDSARASLDVENPSDDEDEEMWFQEPIEAQRVLDQLQAISERADKKHLNEAEMVEAMKRRRAYNRVKLDLPTWVEIELAKVGVEGKTLKDDAEVKAYRMDKKKPFSPETDTHDIDKFLTSQSAQESFSQLSDLTSIQSSVHGMCLLLSKADNLNSDLDTSGGHLNSLLYIVRTHHFLWSKFVSDVATEVALSFKQHCSRGEFVIKKLKDWNCLLLVKPTRSGSHVFFSLYSKEVFFDRVEDCGNVFRNWNRKGASCWTDFISLDKSKVCNWALAESRAISLTPYWLEFYGCPPYMMSVPDLSESGLTKEEHDDLKLKIEEAHKMTWISTLIGLCDKAEVEEACTVSRFMVMEGFVGYPLTPRPEKMFKKLPSVIRSRFTAWVCQKLLNLCLYVGSKSISSSVGEPQSTQDIDSTTVTREFLIWSGLKNWFTGYPLMNPGQVVDLFYVGYIKNKNEDSEVNSESKLLDKILVLESKLTPEIKSRIGVLNKPLGSNTYHEWNIDALKGYCQLVKFDKKNLYVGGDLSKSLSEELTRKLIGVKVEDVFLTLKASSNFGPDWFLYADYAKKGTDQRNLILNTGTSSDKGESADAPPFYNKKRFYTRSKVLEKCLLYSGDDRTTLLDILPVCFEEIKSNGYLRICIFKKQQHGGLREIYVLNFAERVVQYVIELAGRTICNIFPGETMTHPEAKKTMLQNHHARVRAEQKGRVVMTTYTSADASKWSQNQYCFKLASVLVLMFPKKWHSFFLHSLELWKNKKIKISDDLLYLFEHGNTSQFWDDTIQKLYKEYKGLGEEEGKWMQPGSSYVTTTSGMMQGILHYLSSAFHSIVNYGISTTLKEMVEKRSPLLGLTCSMVQSSDDSGMMLSLSYDADKISSHKAATLLAYLHYYKIYISEEMSIKNSEKTTAHTPRVFEFNSCFFFGEQQYEADLKMLYASANVSELESLIERQEESYTLISGYVGSGGSFYSAKFAQYGQGAFFYRSLGATVSKTFYPYSAGLAKLKDPSMGFFLTDSELCCGVPGFSFNHWNCAVKTELGNIYQSQLEQITKSRSDDAQVPVDDIKQVMPSGAVLRRVRLSWGNSKKLNRLKDKMKLSKDWVQKIDDDPSLLFREARTSDELKLKVSLKLASKGVSSSLSTGVPVTSLMASALYCIQERVFYLSDETNDEETIEVNFKGKRQVKASLAMLVKSAMQLKGRQLNREELKLLFPLYEEYQVVRSEMAGIVKHCCVRKVIERKRVTTTVNVFTGGPSVPLVPINVLKNIWFPGDQSVKGVKYGPRLLKAAFNEVTAVIPWVKEDFSETLKSSPFEHAHQVVSWLRQLEEKTRVVTFLGCPMVSKRGRTTLRSAMINNHHKFYKLSLEIRDESHMTETDIKAVCKTLIGMVTLPMRQEVKEQKIADTLILMKDVGALKYDNGKIKSRSNTLATIALALSPTSNAREVYEQIERNKKGYVGFWKKPQRFSLIKARYEGPGVWMGFVAGVETTVEVKSTETCSHLVSITVSSLSEIEKYEWCLNLSQWCKDNAIEMYPDSPTRGRGLAFRPPSSLCYKDGHLRRDGLGCPVNIEPRQGAEFVKEMPANPRFSIKIPDEEACRSRGNILIRLMMNSLDTTSKRWTQFTITSVSLSARDWDAQLFVPLSQTIDIQGSFTYSWVSNSRMTPLSLESYLVSENRESTRSLVTTSLKYKLLNMGICPDGIVEPEPLWRPKSTVATETAPESQNMLADFISDSDIFDIMDDIGLEASTPVESDQDDYASDAEDRMGAWALPGLELSLDADNITGGNGMSWASMMDLEDELDARVNQQIEELLDESSELRFVDKSYSVWNYVVANHPLTNMFVEQLKQICPLATMRDMAKTKRFLRVHSKVARILELCFEGLKLEESIPSAVVVVDPNVDRDLI
uniref:RNA-directed RNA polymerase L n=1 Tax=Santiago bunya-like virus TaxID=2716673 RepID=A0A6G7PS93_9VIRU|nr:RNA-dependent RNA polymerase [Santiago bunya-like virus]